MNDQATNLRRQVKLRDRKNLKKAKTLSVISGKGGVGKSNFALNFALELINVNKRVLLFDLDIGMGNIDILLGLQSKYSIIDMLDKRLSIYKIVEKGPNDLAYIAGGSSLTEIFTINQEKMNYFLEQYEDIATNYDYIIFDLGAGISKESLFFILSSDETIVITTPEPTSITDAYSVVKYIVSEQPKMPFHLVMNRAESMKVGREAMNRFINVALNFLKIEINNLGVLPYDPIVSDAVIQQTPYVILNKRAPVSRAMKRIVLDYIDDLTKNRYEFKQTFTQRLRQFFLGR